MKAILLIINLFFISDHILSQNDTVIIELKKSSMTLRKCKGILFQQYFGNTFSYPQTNKIDSSFIYNKDTIFFKIYKNQHLIISGKKYPESEAIDTIKFYKNGLVVREEIWVHQYFLNTNNEITSSSENALYASSDKVTWIKKVYLKKGKIKLEKIKTIEVQKNNQVCLKTIRKRKNRMITIECKCYTGN